MLACQSAMEVAVPFFLTPPHLAIGVREEGKEVNRSGQGEYAEGQGAHPHDRHLTIWRLTPRLTSGTWQPP